MANIEQMQKTSGERNVDRRLRVQLKEDWGSSSTRQHTGFVQKSDCSFPDFSRTKLLLFPDFSRHFVHLYV